MFKNYLRNFYTNLLLLKIPKLDSIKALFIINHLEFLSVILIVYTLIVKIYFKSVLGFNFNSLIDAIVLFLVIILLKLIQLLFKKHFIDNKVNIKLEILKYFLVWSLVMVISYILGLYTQEYWWAFLSLLAQKSICFMNPLDSADPNAEENVNARKRKADTEYEEDSRESKRNKYSSSEMSSSTDDSKLNYYRDWQASDDGFEEEETAEKYLDVSVLPTEDKTDKKNVWYDSEDEFYAKGMGDVNAPIRKAEKVAFKIAVCIDADRKCYSEDELLKEEALVKRGQDMMTSLNKAEKDINAAVLEEPYKEHLPVTIEARQRISSSKSRVTDAYGVEESAENNS